MLVTARRASTRLVPVSPSGGLKRADVEHTPDEVAAIVIDVVSAAVPVHTPDEVAAIVIGALPHVR